MPCWWLWWRGPWAWTALAQQNACAWPESRCGSTRGWRLFCWGKPCTGSISHKQHAVPPFTPGPPPRPSLFQEREAKDASAAPRNGGKDHALYYETLEDTIVFAS